MFYSKQSQGSLDAVSLTPDGPTEEKNNRRVKVRLLFVHTSFTFVNPSCFHTPFLLTLGYWTGKLFKTFCLPHVIFTAKFPMAFFVFASTPHRHVHKKMFATLSDWLKNLETKTHCNLYPKTFPRFQHVIGNCKEFWLVHCAVCSCCELLEELLWFLSFDLKAAINTVFFYSYLKLYFQEINILLGRQHKFRLSVFVNYLKNANPGHRFRVKAITQITISKYAQMLE